MAKEKSTYYNFRVPKWLLEKFKDKESWIPVPLKLRRLMEKYVNDEVDLSDEKNPNP